MLQLSVTHFLGEGWAFTKMEKGVGGIQKVVQDWGIPRGIDIFQRKIL